MFKPVSYPVLRFRPIVFKIIPRPNLLSSTSSCRGHPKKKKEGTFRPLCFAQTPRQPVTPIVSSRTILSLPHGQKNSPISQSTQSPLPTSEFWTSLTFFQVLAILTPPRTTGLDIEVKQLQKVCRSNLCFQLERSFKQVDFREETAPWFSLASTFCTGASCFRRLASKALSQLPYLLHAFANDFCNRQPSFRPLRDPSQTRYPTQ